MSKNKGYKQYTYETKKNTTKWIFLGIAGIGVGVSIFLGVRIYTMTEQLQEYATQIEGLKADIETKENSVKEEEVKADLLEKETEKVKNEIWRLSPIILPDDTNQSTDAVQ